MDNIVTFPSPSKRKRVVHSRKPRAEYGSRVLGERKNMQALLFRSRESILQSDEPDLVRDVCFDIDGAQGKLERIRARIESLQEYAATELQLLRDADAKLSGALVAALLSTQMKG